MKSVERCKKQQNFLKIFQTPRFFATEGATKSSFFFQSCAAAMIAAEKTGRSNWLNASCKSDKKEKVIEADVLQPIPGKRRSLIQFVKEDTGSHVEWEFVGGGGVPVESFKIFCRLVGGLVEDEPSVGGWKV